MDYPIRVPQPMLDKYIPECAELRKQIQHYNAVLNRMPSTHEGRADVLAAKSRTQEEYIHALENTVVTQASLLVDMIAKYE